MTKTFSSLPIKTARPELNGRTVRISTGITGLLMRRKCRVSGGGCRGEIDEVDALTGRVVGYGGPDVDESAAGLWGGALLIFLQSADCNESGRFYYPPQ